jgi:hypothetical protein
MLQFLLKNKLVHLLCNQPLAKFATTEMHLAFQQRLWNRRLKVQLQMTLQMKNPVRYLRLARARAVVQTEKTCQLHRMIYQVQFGGIGAVM